MAKIINVEKSQYLTQNIENYAQNKVGQYSKFLDKNPIFVTWLSINRVKTRNDVGTGGVESDVGPKSPIRYNRINGIPTYNIPDLRPEVIYDENGYDINIDISDAVLLPGTIKPQTGDYLIITLPSSVEVAFRVNEFSYNTIQSNDFYLYSADLKFTGKDLISRFEGQIDENDVFETIFDSIGTEDKCLIRTVDVAKVKNIGLLFNELRDLYKQNYFDQLTGNFVSKENHENLEGTDDWLYDKYVEKFIMDSGIYFSATNDPNSIVLAPADIVENSDKLYQRTLFKAVLSKDTAYMARFPWYYQVDIQKRLSTFNVHHIACKSAIYHLTDYPLLDDHSDGLDTGALLEIFPHPLIHKILDEDGIEDVIVHKYDPHNCWKFASQLEENSELNEIEGEDVTDEIGRDPDSMSVPELIDEINHTSNSDSSEGNSSSESASSQYDIRCGRCTHNTHCPYKDMEEPPVLYHPCSDDEYTMTYLDEIVYNFLLGKKLTIDRQKLVRFALQTNNYVYRMMPLIIYIVLDYYNSYFKKEGTEEL